MTTLTKEAAFWTKIARKYAADPIRDMDGYLHTLERTKSYLKPDDQVLEVGCGTGSTALELAPLVGHITGTDLAAGMIEIAEEKRCAAGRDNVTFQVQDVTGDQVNGAGYDVVMAHNLLHLVPDLGVAIARIAGEVKKGGLFISKTPCAPARGRFVYGILRYLAIPLMQVVGKAPAVSFSTEAGLEDVITSAGFEVVEAFTQGGILPVRYVVARKV